MDDVIVVHYSSSKDPPFTEDDSAIISRCDPKKGNTIQLNPKVLVKYRNVSIEECRNQVEARRLLDPKIVIVPEVHRYFSKGSQNYLVMEFIKGTVRDLIEDDKSIQRIARIINHLHTYESRIPGPLCGGTSRGFFWEREHVVLGNTERLERYINTRVVGPGRDLRFEVGKLVLNHNDIAPRNIIWMPDGSVCLIDWEHAGYYPWLLEIVVLDINMQQGKDEVFVKKLQIELGPLTTREQSDLDLLIMAWDKGLRFWQQVSSIR
jgi:aminoglycoside phosphotransferase (APT) family kinase protein